MTEHEILVATRNVIDRVGWVQGDLGGPDRGYCLLGGLCQGYRGLPTPRGLNPGDAPEFYRAYGLIYDRLPRGGIPAWNNVPGRTKAEVLALLDGLISETAPAPDVSFIRPAKVAEEVSC